LEDEVKKRRRRRKQKILGTRFYVHGYFAIKAKHAKQKNKKANQSHVMLYINATLGIDERFDASQGNSKTEEAISA